MIEQTLAQPPDSTQESELEPGRRPAVAAQDQHQAAGGRRRSFLDQLSTSVTGPESFGDRQWMADFEWYYHDRMAPTLESLQSQRTSQWAQQRARSVGLNPSARLLVCGRRFRGVRCGCRTLVMRVGCGAKWCSDCQEKKFRPLRRRLKRALDMHERARNRARRKQRWRWVLLTLTVAHSGSLERDRAVIVAAWRRLRQWLWKRIGKFPFVLVWECTEGCDHRGHLHAHVAALWPWLNWTDVHTEWVRASGGASNHIDIQRAKKGSNGCAKYLAKYSCKGVELGEMRPEIAAEFVRATYNKRVVYASENFWRPTRDGCACCDQPWRATDKPEAMTGLIPGALLEATMRADGIEMVRSDKQKPLFWTAASFEPD